MKTKMLCLLVLFSGVVLSFSSCSGLQKPVVLETKPYNVVDIKVSDYKFRPNFLQTYQGYTIVFKLENVSDKDHNFTLRNPNGNVIQDIDIMAGKTAEVKVVFSSPGTYKFHCNKDLHAELGMKGEVMVLPK